MQSRIVGRKGLVYCLAEAGSLAFITKGNKKIQNLFIRHIKDKIIGRQTAMKLSCTRGFSFLIICSDLVLKGSVNDSQKLLGKLE